MPLLHGKSKKAFEHNVKTEYEAGKPLKQSLAIAYQMKKKKKMAEGGMVGAEKSGYMDHEGNDVKHNGMAVMEVDKDLNQHHVMPVDSGKYGEVNHEMREHQSPLSSLDRFQDGDIVDYIMRKKYSQGGMVANGGDDDLNKLADGKPNNFDDLALRDDLESSYGDDDNAGDALGNQQEDEDRADIVAHIMRQRKMKQHNPRPA